MKYLKQLVIALSATVSLNFASAQKPNVVIIYGDDVGYGDVGVYGSEKIPTPNIDRLAAEGLRFTDGHSSASTCTPSRFSLLTGIHGFRHGVRILPPNAPLSIPTDILTLPKLFNQAEYQTAVIGKWHLGIGEKDKPVDWNSAVKPGPLEIGFKSSFLLPSTNDRVPCVYLRDHYVVNLDSKDPLYVDALKMPEAPHSTTYPDGETDRSAMTYYQSTRGHDNSVINGIGRIGFMAGGQSALWNDETMADVFINEAKRFIAKNKDRPFFLYFASQDIHVPRAPHPRFQGTTQLSYRGDAMVQFDWSTGQILDALEANGLSENTIVIFSSDNGPVYDDGYDDGTTVRGFEEEVDRGHDASGLYRGGKYQIAEGGTRVPFIVRWPARINPGVSHALVNQIDLLASLAALLEIDIPETEARDSQNTLSAFLGDDPIGRLHMIEESWHIALRSGKWKYIPKGKKSSQIGSLYNLDTDPSESNDLSENHPNIARDLDALLRHLSKNN